MNRIYFFTIVLISLVLTRTVKPAKRPCHNRCAKLSTKTCINKKQYVQPVDLYRKEADIWLQKYIVNDKGNLLILPKELQLIANLIYFSLRRSQVTLEAQEIALRTLNQVWKGWQNIAQNRLDPSKNPPYKIAYEDSQELMNLMWMIHDEYRKIGQTYDHAVQLVVHGNILMTHSAKEAVSDMRAQARKIVAESLVDVRKYFGSLFYQKKNNDTTTKGFAFMDYIWSYIPQLAVSSFVEANKTNDTISEESWSLLMKIQNIGKRTWEVIETERAAFYLAFYKAILQVFDYFDLDDGYLKIMFDEHGQIPIDFQHEFLPEVSTDKYM